MIGNLLYYVCAKTCQNSARFDEVITKNKTVQYFPHAHVSC